MLTVENLKCTENMKIECELANSRENPVLQMCIWA